MCSKKVDFPQWLALSRTIVCRAALLHVRKGFKPTSSLSACMLWHDSSYPALFCCVCPITGWWERLQNGVSTSVFESVCVCWANSYQTGAETLHLHPRHHLHRPFPAYRVIPAPSLPPLPSHTYQPPAAVPLPECGSSSLDTVDKQQQLVHLSLFYLFSLLSLTLWQYSLRHSIITYHLTSFPQVMRSWIVLPGPLRL